MLRKRAFLKSFTLAASGLFVPRILAADPLRQRRTAPPPPSRKAANRAVYVLSEDCEGLGTPSGWSDTGAVDWDQSVVVFEGLHSVGFSTTGGAAYSVYALPSAYSFLSCFFAVKRTSVTTTPRVIFRLRNGTTDLCVVTYTTTTFTVNHGTQSAVVNGTYNSSNYYCVWLDYTKGSGADGLASITVGLTKVKSEGSAASLTNGSSILDVDNVLIGYAGAHTSTTYHDHIRVADYSIGDQ